MYPKSRTVLGLDPWTVTLALVLAGKNVPPFRFRTPNGKGIGSSPAISGGRIYFGCDDGNFYILGPDGQVPPAPEPASQRGK
jgi:outer membrane protein assembly factor BamB